MQPASNGRHCFSCNKTVIDFSVMNDGQVEHFFSGLQDEGVCGRFKNAQLEKIRINVPAYIFNKPIAAWKKYLVILLVCFGSTFLSVDVALGNITCLTSLVQGRPAHSIMQSTKKITKKKKKKRIIRIKKPVISLTDFTMTLGFVQSGIEPKFTLFPSIYSTDENTSIKNIRPLSDTLESKKETPHNKEEDNSNPAFIMPATLYRRRKIKRKD